MGFLNLQMIQWVFQLMGNHISCMHHLSSTSTTTPEADESSKKKQKQKQKPSQSQSQLRTIKLIKSDGIVKIYNRPINASEVMLEFPKHLVCHSDSFYIGKKIPPLSENEKLQLGQKYFLLPIHFFQSVLSFVTIASSFAANNSQSDPKNAFLKKAAAAGGLPFDIQKTPSGSLQIRVSDEFISNLLMEEEEEEVHDQQSSSSSDGGGNYNYLCTTPQLQKDYNQLVGCNRQWKPKLDSIKESRMRRLGSFGIKMRRSRNNNKSDDEQQISQKKQQQQQNKKMKNTQRSVPEQQQHHQITSSRSSSSN